MKHLKLNYNLHYKKLLNLFNLNFLALFVINFYKTFLSNYFVNSCRFIPSCSEYGKIAFQSQPFHRACWLTFKRILRCHPCGSYGYDPIPRSSQKHE